MPDRAGQGAAVTWLGAPPTLAEPLEDVGVGQSLEAPSGCGHPPLDVWWE